MSSVIANTSFKGSIDRHKSCVQFISWNQHAHEEAKELVPIAEIVQGNEDILEGDYNDKFLPHLVKWFSTEFFTWFEAPKCQNCTSPSQSKLVNCSIDCEGKAVEKYCCVNAPNCNFTFDFIRHNDPSILLHTKTGRCGEWAHCFYVFLRALDYDARVVYDYTDHVWNEVYSESQKRWIHVDPCESVIDTPLLYEVGWGKRLNYCIAFSQYEVTDVTRRYVIDYESTKRNRHKCDESWLDQYLHQVTYDLLKDSDSNQMRDTIVKRMRDRENLKQLASSPRPIPDKSQLMGRKTGGLAWRIERGEYCISSKNSFVINVARAENHAPNKDKEFFFIKYNCDKDLYSCSDPDLNDKKRWCTLTYEYENVDRKYEKDWRTSYLARYENCPADNTGKIVWRFDLTRLDEFDRVEVTLKCEIYPDTSVKIVLISYGLSTEDRLMEFSIQPNEVGVLKRNQLGSRAKLIDLIVTLSGGDPNDEVAWQKPQLFRQTRDHNSDDIPFSIKFY